MRCSVCKKALAVVDDLCTECRTATEFGRESIRRAFEIQPDTRSPEERSRDRNKGSRRKTLRIGARKQR